MPQIAIPLDSEIIGEMFLRVGPTVDISNWIENVVRGYLERTADDTGKWSDAYNAYRESQVAPNDFTAEFGDPKGGYHWAPLFLPNGTLIRMEYKKKVSQAAVKHNKIDLDGASYSPSELASFIAAGTNRNAWRDLLIKLPGRTDWCLAEQLRRQLPK
ncbi:MAG: hypothetical protein Q7T07_13050 [Burkholderiaceae bacterium]|nr:hypothetical protein [Burkholderiaceae bacterium]